MARRTASSGSDGSSSEEFAFRPKQAEHEQRTRDGAVHDGKVAMWVAMGASVLGLLCSAYGIFSFRLDDSFFCGAFVITAVGWGILIGVEVRPSHHPRRTLIADSPVARSCSCCGSCTRSGEGTTAQSSAARHSSSECVPLFLGR